MKVWFVDFDINIPFRCAWTKRQDAINYFKNKANECKWTFNKKEFELEVARGFEMELDFLLNDNYHSDAVYIYQLSLDEKV